MRRLLIFISFLCILQGCKKKEQLEDIKFDDNPYDNAYTGPNVVLIGGAERIQTGISTFVSKIYVNSSTDLYHFVLLYRNGVLIRTMPRSNHSLSSTIFTETIIDNTAISGVTYNYTASLKYVDALTKKSDAFVYLTP